MIDGKLKLIFGATIVCAAIFFLIGKYGSIIGSAYMAFVFTLFMTSFAKNKFELIGLVAMDVQKKNKPKMATSGGIPVVIGFLLGISAYIAYTTFISNAPTNLTLIYAGITTILLMTLLTGLFDDIIILPEQKTHKGEIDTRIGLRQSEKLLLSALAVFPLMVVNAGASIINIPFFGQINFGLFYPLLIVPLIVIFCSNAANMLAGMNGLETGCGAVLLGFTGAYALLYGNVEGAITAIIMTGALLGFLYYNKYPAKYLPGDSLTYLIGSTFAASIIMGNIEKFAAIAFIPWFVEFFLKARMKFQASSLGVLQKDGTLKPKYKKIYSWTHIAMRIVKKEKYVAPFMMFVVSAFCMLAFIISRVFV